MTQDQAIVIQNGIIESVQGSDAVDYELIDIIVNLQGQYAMPGLWDMHMHLRGGPQLIDARHPFGQTLFGRQRQKPVDQCRVELIDGGWLADVAIETK